jgi:hypothetical protein
MTRQHLAINLLEKHPNTIILDAQPQDEFDKKASTGFHNLGP